MDHAGATGGVFIAGAEALVGDVECGEHRNLQRVPLRALTLRERHLLLDIHGELGDVRRVEVAADRIPLPVDVHRYDAGLVHMDPCRCRVPGATCKVLRATCAGLRTAGTSMSRPSNFSTPSALCTEHFAPSTFTGSAPLSAGACRRRGYECARARRAAL